MPIDTLPRPRDNDVVVSASILGADFLSLHDEIQRALSAGADWLHIDVMDGHFVPNLSMGLPVLKKIRAGFPDVFLDVHLMISNPLAMAPAYAAAGANLVTFHAETDDSPERVIAAIKQTDPSVGVGLAVSPETNIDRLKPMLDMVDLILVMSVVPGFGGQSFLEESYSRLADCRSMIDCSGLSGKVWLQVDGGVSDKNAKSLVECGARSLVAGTFLFSASDFGAAVAALK